TSASPALLRRGRRGTGEVPRRLRPPVDAVGVLPVHPAPTPPLGHCWRVAPGIGPGSLFPLAPSAVWSLVPPTLAPTPPHSTATANSTHAPRSSAIPGPPRRRSSVARDVSPRTVGTCTCPTPPPGSGSCHWSSAGTSRRTALLALGLGRPPPSEFDTACPRPAGRSSSDQADPPWPGRTVPALLRPPRSAASPALAPRRGFVGPPSSPPRRWRIPHADARFASLPGECVHAPVVLVCFADLAPPFANYDTTARGSLRTNRVTPPRRGRPHRNRCVAVGSLRDVPRARSEIVAAPRCETPPPRHGSGA